MFFKEFPVIPYQFNINGKNTLRMVKDITKGVKLTKEFLDRLDYYSEYDIVEGDTIERIAEKLYGNANYHWLLMLANDRFDYTKDFPREYKFTLGQDLKRDGISLVRSIYRANKSKEKTPYLEAFLDDFELVKLELRLCADMNLLPLKKHAEISVLMDRIGKQITAWRNSQAV